MFEWSHMDAERGVQRQFRMRAFIASLILVTVVLQAHRWFLLFPNHHELGWRTARIEFRPIAFDSASLAPFKLAGAWQLTSDDPRFGGISALAIDRGRMLALTDSGVLVRFSAPGQPQGPAWIGELPDGPGSPDFKRNRDSEALLRDPDGRGWWVAFENRDELWLYDAGLGHALKRIQLGDHGWGSNRGVEGLAAEGASMLLLPESGNSLLRVTGTQARLVPIAHCRCPRPNLRCRSGWPRPISRHRTPTDPVGVPQCAGAAGKNGVWLPIWSPHGVTAWPARQCGSAGSRTLAEWHVPAVANDR